MAQKTHSKSIEFCFTLPIYLPVLLVEKQSDSALFVYKETYQLDQKKQALDCRF